MADVARRAYENNVLWLVMQDPDVGADVTEAAKKLGGDIGWRIRWIESAKHEADFPKQLHYLLENRRLQSFQRALDAESLANGHQTA